MQFQGRHIPVLYHETLSWLDLRPGQIVVDGTLGASGHARGMLERILPGGMLIGIDKDQEALERAEKTLAPYRDHVRLVHSDFKDIDTVLQNLGIEAVDRALLDLGVSSFQLEDAGRGFSYMQNGTLDMRMDQTASRDALSVVNTYPQDRLEEILRKYGEEKWSRRIAQLIVESREQRPIETTESLVEIVRNAIPSSARRTGPHPAKRTFQAIRIEVNGELSGLDDALASYIEHLSQDGRLAVITFHSLEDRIVKQEFALLAHPCVCPPDLPVCACGRQPRIRFVTRKPVIASNVELADNPRARSAKLRVVEKI